ncbi:hypothetical protein Lfu02_66660 [Longispora fulva]|nr:hypothetical protein Lfu02_66660 [Longispora fulva]
MVGEPAAHHRIAAVEIDHDPAQVVFVEHGRRPLSGYLRAGRSIHDGPRWPYTPRAFPPYNGAMKIVCSGEFIAKVAVCCFLTGLALGFLATR